MKRLKFAPIREDEGLSWEALCDRLDRLPATKPKPVLFNAPEQKQTVLEAQPDDRAPPSVLTVSPEVYTTFSAYGVQETTRWVYF